MSDSTIIKTEIQSIPAHVIISNFEEIKRELERIKKTVNPNDEVVYMSRKEVAELLGVSETTVNNWKKKNLLVSYSLGNAVRYKKHEVIEAFAATI